jgi:hypothetical protein
MPITTTYFQLTKPDHGQTNWDGPMNANLDAIDSRMAGFMGPVNVVASSASPLFDLSKGHIHYCRLTMAAPTPLVQNPIDGQPYRFIIPQDAVGGHTFTFPSSFKGAGVISTANLNALPNTANSQTFTWIAADSTFYADGPMINY